jgi:2-oxoglutarate ferredoxin oxidoreductase subunit alpha
METLRAEGVKVGLFRPITVWPFPDKEVEALSKKVKRILVVEHNAGQLLLEVQRVVKDNCKVDFLGRINGTVIGPDTIAAKVKED